MLQEKCSDKNIDISIILTTYEESRIEYLKQCVKSLVNQNTTSEYEVVVIAEDISLSSEVFSHDLVRVINIDSSSGLSEARNIGANEANGKYLWFVDDDCIVPDGTLQTLQEKKPDIGGGPSYPIWEGNGGRPKRIPSEFLWLVGCTNLEFDIKEGRPYGCNFFIKKEYFKGFNSNLGKSHGFNLQGEDAELFERVTSEYDVVSEYMTEAPVHHVVEENQLKHIWLFKRAFLQGKTKAALENIVENSLETENEYLSYLFKKMWKSKLRVENIYIILYTFLTVLGYVHSKSPV